MKWVTEGNFGTQVWPFGWIVLCGINVFTLHSKACARPSNGDTLFDRIVQRLLHRRSAPEINVVGLIASRNKNRLGLGNCICHKWIRCRSLVWNDKSGNRIQMTEVLYVFFISIGARRSYNQKVSRALSLAHPEKCGVQILSPTNERKARFGLTTHVSRIADSKIAISTESLSIACKRKPVENQCTDKNRVDAEIRWFHDLRFYPPAALRSFSKAQYVFNGIFCVRKCLSNLEVLIRHFTMACSPFIRYHDFYVSRTIQPNGRSSGNRFSSLLVSSVIRTTKRPPLSDKRTADPKLDREIDCAVLLACLALSALLSTSESIFPQKREAWYQPSGED